MDDLRRMHYVTEHYQQLQGLRLLPLGVAVLLAIPFGHGFTPLGLTPTAAFLLLLAASVAVSFPIRRYYTERFGHVEPRRWRTGAVTWIASAVACLSLLLVQEARPVPVSLPMLFVSLALARLGLAAGRLRVHYLWMAAGGAALAMLPLVGVPPVLRGSALNALIGVALVVAAIGDDRVLRRVLTRQGQGGRTSAS